LAPLAACSTVKEAALGPELSPAIYPAAVLRQNQPATSLATARDPAPAQASANSLWRAGARAFFIDQRAARVGDILTGQIDIDDSAKTTNNTSASRTSGQTAAIPHLLGLEQALGRVLPGGYDPSNALETSSQTSNAGSGA